MVDFLSASLKDGTINAEDKDSVDIAQACIADIFHVNPSDSAQMKEAIGNQSLLQIYSVYDKIKGSSAASASKSNGAKAAPSTTSTDGGSTKGSTNEEAEKFKSQGNEAMKKKEFPAAIDAYTKAMNISPSNPVYLSNRAAAYSGAGQHAEASDDAEMAVATDPKFTKAWSRLGYARLGLGDAKGSVEAYEKGIEYEGNGGSEIMKKALTAAKQKLAAEEAEHDEDEDAVDEGAKGVGQQASGMPDLSALAGMFGGGRGGGGGGMPGMYPPAPSDIITKMTISLDMSTIMNNPMFANMAQKVMADPSALQGLMNNPQLRNLANQFGGGGANNNDNAGAQGGASSGGGGMPDLASMMNDPSLQEMAKKFLGGQGRGGGA